MYDDILHPKLLPMASLGLSLLAQAGTKPDPIITNLYVKALAVAGITTDWKVAIVILAKHGIKAREIASLLPRARSSETKDPANQPRQTVYRAMKAIAPVLAKLRGE